MEKKLCPLMVDAGYPENLCQCNIPRQLREKVKDCAKDNKCQVAKYVPEAVSAFGRCEIDGKKIPENDIRHWREILQTTLMAPATI